MTIIVSKPNRALALPMNEQVKQLFPEAKELPHPGGNLAVIKHGLAEYIILRRLGHHVPNPITCYYDWTGGKPFDVQRVTCSLLTANPRAYVLNDMGTGKTKAALWAWDYLRSNKYGNRLLVVAPLSTLNFVWARECFATLPHRKCVVLHGTKKKRLELLKQDADVYVINHDGLKVVGDELKFRTDIDVMVIDELATYRNKNPRSKFMEKFAEKFTFVWGMTGSPMPNEPVDVWQQCKIITPHTVPKYQTHARDVLMRKQSEYVWVPKPNAVETAFSWMQPAVRFSLDDVVELPDVAEQWLDVNLGAQQKHVYKVLSTEYLAQVGSQQITAVNAVAAMNKLLQVSSGWVYTDLMGSVKLDPDDRLSMLRTLVMGTTGKVLVFAAFKHVVYGLSKLFTGDPNKEDDDFIEHAVVTGDTPQRDRDHIYNLFQNTTKYKAIVAHPQCMAHGLTLTAADTIIWYGPLANLEVYEQANARIRRVGQKHKQRVIHLQGTPVEKKIYALLRSKAKVQDMLLSLFEEATLAAQS